jgi:hypothetical protein
MTYDIPQGFLVPQEKSLIQFRREVETFIVERQKRLVNSNGIKQVVFAYDLINYNDGMLANEYPTSRFIKPYIDGNKQPYNLLQLLIAAPNYSPLEASQTVTLSLFPGESTDEAILGYLSGSKTLFKELIDEGLIRYFGVEGKVSGNLKTWDSRVDLKRPFLNQGFNIQPLTNVDNIFDVWHARNNDIELPSESDRIRHLASLGLLMKMEKEKGTRNPEGFADYLVSDEAEAFEEEISEIGLPKISSENIKNLFR